MALSAGYCCLADSKSIKKQGHPAGGFRRIFDIIPFEKLGLSLLFVSGDLRQELFEIVDYTKDKPVLTVRDREGFEEEGIHINFYIEKEKIRFEINESAVRRSRLRMSHMLLQQAKILNPKEEFE